MSVPLVSALAQLMCVLILAALIRRFLMVPGPPPVAAGAIVMAGGIATLDAVQRIPPFVGTATRLATCCLLVIGAYIAVSYLTSIVDGTFRRYTDDPVDSFALGTWVAGVSVLAQTVILAFPGWRSLSLVLGAVSLALYLGYLAVVARAFRAALPAPVQHEVTGRILLSTVATQSVVILVLTLLPTEPLRGILAVLLILGYLFYLVGTALVIERYRPSRRWSLAGDWDTTNCILHGAMSITGLAGILTGILPIGWIDGTWLWVAGTFAVVETIELARARARVRVYSWREGLFTYHVTQWARVFTFGMCSTPLPCTCRGRRGRRSRSLPFCADRSSITANSSSSVSWSSRLCSMRERTFTSAGLLSSTTRHRSSGLQSPATRLPSTDDPQRFRFDTPR